MSRGGVIRRAIAKAMGRGPRAVLRDPAPDPDAMARAKSWGMSRTHHGREPGPIEGENLRPSKDGVLGPGIYTHDVKDGAARYGDEVEELMVSDKLAPVRLLDETLKRLRSEGVSGGEAMKRAVAELKAQGYEGVRDGPVRAIWAARDVRSVRAAFKDRDSRNIMAGVGVAAGAGAALRTNNAEPVSAVRRA